MTNTARLTIAARDLHHADRILNLVEGRTVTAFDLDVADDVVAIFPAQADLDAGIGRRIDVDGDVQLTVERAVDGTPVDGAARPAPARPIIAQVVVRSRRYTASREGVEGGEVRVVVRNTRGDFAGEVYAAPAFRMSHAIVVGCPATWTGHDSRGAAAEILAQLGA